MVLMMLKKKVSVNDSDNHATGLRYHAKDADINFIYVAL